MRRWMMMGLGLMIAAIPGQAQQTQPTFEQITTRAWKAEHDKILDMARDFPAELFDTRPHEDSRSFLEEVRHVTIGLEMSSAQLQGEAFDYEARVAEDDGKPATRESIVGEMEAAIAESYPLVEAGDSPAMPRLVFWMGHQGEHYGKLVTIYRMNDLVPPISRGES